jgi:hypothetical protein
MSQDYPLINIHDAIRNIPAPPVDEASLAEALKKVRWVNSVEEAAKLIIEEDQP